jgi:acetyl esterase/lipase
VAPLRIPARAVRCERDVPYGPAGRENQLDVYRPRSQSVGCPVLVYLHPGGLFSGRKSRQSRALFDRLVGDGWVCVSANYGLGRAGAFPNNLVDAKRVIAWVRAHAADLGADPSTLVVCGGSAGAYLGSMCALTADDPTFQPGFERADTSVSAAVGLYGFYGSAPSSEPD